MTSLLIIGGCSLENELGGLKSIESIRLEEKSGKIRLISRRIGELKESRRSPSAFYNKSTKEILIFGGCKTTGEHLNSAEILNDESDHKQLIDFPSLHGHSCAAHCSLSSRQEALIFGGYDGQECRKEVYLINSQKEAKQLPDFCSRLKNAVAVSLPDSVLLIGGWDENQTMRTIFRITVAEDRNNYSTVMHGLLPYPLEGHSAVLQKNHIYIIGGYDGISVRSNIIRMDINSGEKKILPIELSIARENHVCAILEEKYLLVAGGWDGKKALSSVEIFEINEEEPFLRKIPGEFSLEEVRNRPASLVL